MTCRHCLGPTDEGTACARCWGAMVAKARKRQDEDRARCSGPGHYGSVSWWYWLSGEAA